MTTPTRHDALPPTPVFDGHNDVLLRLWKRGAGDPVAAFFDGADKAQLDLPRAIAGGFIGGLYAIFVPSGDLGLAALNTSMSSATYDVPLPSMVETTAAQHAVLAMASLLFRIERASQGRVRVCRSVADIRACMVAGVQAPVLHIEGAEAIDRDFHMLEVLHAAGLRSLGPVWSRTTIFAHGVPFKFPSSPDIGPGLTDIGRELIRRCNALRIMIDLSHLNEAGFWDIAKLSTAPLVATHSNAHALCQHSRNLTDKQLAAIKDSDGMVGVNFAVSFLRPDGRRDPTTPVTVVVDHIEYLIRHLGEDRVGLGSDFDGAAIPMEIDSAAGLPKLVAAMRARGFGETLITKICTGNWLRVLEKTWGA
jgi:membrane dipeptidase